MKSKSVISDQLVKYVDRCYLGNMYNVLLNIIHFLFPCKESLMLT